MSTFSHNSPIGYIILFYCSVLLALVIFLSHYELNTQKMSTKIKQPPQTSLKPLSSEKRANNKELTSTPTPLFKKKSGHSYNNHERGGDTPFSYDTREPESFKSRSIPKFSSFKDVSQKKEAFIRFFKVIIDEQNVLQIKRREQLTALSKMIKSGGTLDKTALNTFKTLKSIYRIDDDLNDLQSIQELNSRVNIVPGSMVLAQAASESAWGTSRFAKQANNFFGQWCFKKGCGLIPSRRAKNAKHEIAKFKSAESSIRAYFKNLNTYRTYQEFRNLRLDAIQQKQPLKGLELIGGLKNYSERGSEYIEDLGSIIRFNKFDQLFNEK